MASPKSNPKRWYLVMYLCVILSFWVFLAGPRLGYSAEGSHGIAILLGVWGCILAVMGVRAETLQRKD
jgi:hypothetical protein